MTELLLPKEADAAVLSALDERRKGAALTGQPQINAIGATKGWAFGTILLEREAFEARSIEDELAHHGAPESWFYMARVDEKGLWSAAIEWTSAFYEMVTAAPSDVLPPAHKAVFQSDGLAYTASQSASVSDEALSLASAPLITGDPYTDLMLPWRQGESWRLRGGPHGWAGCLPSGVCPRPWSSLDLNGRENIPYEIKSAGNGLAYRPCVNGYIVIKHGNGLESRYYHVDRIPAFIPFSEPGVQVWRTTMLGWTGTRTDCGGSASGPHLHFAIMKNGAYVEWNGQTIGGWTIREGATGYEGVAERFDFNGTLRRARAKTLDPMYNMGVRFQCHFQNLGWTAPQSNFAASVNKGLRMEAIKMALQRPQGCPQDPDIVYQVHVQNIGWQPERRHDEVAGTEGQSLRIEAIRIRLANPPAGQHVAYRVYMEGLGTGPLVFDWQVAGTTGQGRRVEGIQIGLLP